jgi:hypothetical protein
MHLCGFMKVVIELVWTFRYAKGFLTEYTESKEIIRSFSVVSVYSVSYCIRFSFANLKV